MKLNVEIKDDKFIYSYEVGKSIHGGERHLCADGLIMFSSIIQMFFNHFKFTDKEIEREWIIKEYLEKNK